ncbi:centrosomal protein of 135 kDa isoform X2 [Cylas formicarius]|nr:centrosomal protein of 135 kDa isoform X2 [Cylas formicarius]
MQENSERSSRKKGFINKQGQTNLSKQSKIGSDLVTTKAVFDEKIADLSTQLLETKEKHHKLVDEVHHLQNKVRVREDEIARLKSLLEGGRPYKSVSDECCFKNVDTKISVLQDEIRSLEKDKKELHIQLKEALSKQHEAMRRAIHLAERNKQLEKEMKDIDAIALDVEANCNSTVQDNAKKVTRLQDRINESLVSIQNLQRENAKLKHLKVELTADLNSAKSEISQIKRQLNEEAEDKKRLMAKLKDCSTIEHDLNMEIDRLTKLTAQQRFTIEELETQVTGDVRSARKMESHDNEMKETDKQPKSKPSSRKVSKKSTKSKSPPKSLPPIKCETDQKCCCDPDNCVKHLKELLNKEMEYRQASTLQSVELLKQEKDYYMKEYHKVLEQMKPEKPNNCSDLLQKLEEREKLIKHLQSEVTELSKEKSALVSKDPGFDTNGSCNKPLCKRKERELDILRRDLQQAELESATIKSKLQALNETTLFNEERMKIAFQDMEEHIRKLENERRDLVQTDVTQRSNLTQLEENYKVIKEQLRTTQSELNNQRANYTQLKTLHEQTDKALSEAQNQVIRAQTELAEYQSKAKSSSHDTQAYDREIIRLTEDVQIMKNQLTQMDKEKDELLNALDTKTEKIASLENQLRTKTSIVERLEDEMKELRRKMSKYADETTSQGQVVRSKQQELAILEQNYEREKQLREAALLENKRLQNELSSVACDCRDARHELELMRRQVDDLKRQLQHYVAEVKRTEDLISQKEIERGELLDQFKCLSQEANVLENTNHTLENEATQSKIQLSVALDHTADLEKKIEDQESAIRCYERQMTEMTGQIASLEMQLRRSDAEKEQCITELKQMRDLCTKLDKEKDNFKQDRYSKEDYHIQISRNVDTLRSDKEELAAALEKERNNLHSVEKLLTEARQEIIDQRLLNQDLHGEIEKLKRGINDLREKLQTNREQLNLYQEKAAEYGRQNNQLLRDLANERFSKSQSDKQTYPSL